MRIPSRFAVNINSTKLDFFFGEGRLLQVDTFTAKRFGRISGTARLQGLHGNQAALSYKQAAVANTLDDEAA
jgi:hypothetical protein